MSEKKHPVNELVKQHHQEFLERLRKTAELDAMVNHGLPIEWAIVRAEEVIQAVNAALRRATD